MAGRPSGSSALDRALPRRLAACFGVVAAVACGAAVAIDVRAGLAIVAAIAYAILAFVNLRVAIALLVPLFFLEAIPVFNLAAKGAVVVVIVAWCAGALIRPPQSMFGRHRWLPALLVLLLAWLALSVTWAADPGVATSALVQWVAVALLFLVVATEMVDMQAIRLTAAMFVLGAVASMAIGVARGELRPLASSTVDTGRFAGATGDPNLLAAALLPAIVLAVGLLPSRRGPIERSGILLGVLVLAIGLAASGSRGALVAALTTVAVAAVAMKRRRAQVVLVSAVAFCAALLWFSISPETWKRVTTGDGGAGRDELWNVAWTMAGNHPVVGVGLDNFTVVSGDYTRLVGPLESVDLIAVRPHQVHNVYLQMLSEAGFVGLLLFVGFVLLCVAAAVAAARRFGSVGEAGDATLAEAVALATFALLVASLFLSNAVDRRLWVLLALGAGLLTAASRPAHGPSSSATSLTARSYSSGVPMSYQLSKLR
jgi:O-antigen ligase